MFRQYTYVDRRFTLTELNQTTCQAALGYLFIADTTDDESEDFDSIQETNLINIFLAICSIDFI